MIACDRAKSAVKVELIDMARIVTLSGGSPWGLAISGGKDFGSHVKVTKVGYLELPHVLVDRQYVLFENSVEGETEREMISVYWLGTPVLLWFAFRFLIAPTFMLSYSSGEFYFS